MEAIVNYLLQVIVTTLSQVFILLGPGLLLAFLMYFISKFTRDMAAEVFGYRFWIYFTAIGTIIHELGHALFCLIFGHHINDIKLFAPDPETGMLGYVYHSYNPRSLYQVIGNFFIGIGPIILGSLVIWFSSMTLVGQEVFQPLQSIAITPQTFGSLDHALGFLQSAGSSALHVFGGLFSSENVLSIGFYVFLYIIFAIGAHMQLSISDLKGAWSGFSVLVVVLLVFNLATVWIGPFSEKYFMLVGQSYSFFYGYMLFAIILNLAFLGLMALLFVLKRALGGRAGYGWR